jgi:hypothetical protein
LSSQSWVDICCLRFFLFNFDEPCYMSYFVYYDVTTAVVFLSLSYGWLKLTKKLFGLHHFHNVIASTVIRKRILAYWWCILVIDSALWWTLGKLGKLVILISFPNVNRRFTLGWRVRTRLYTGQERNVVLMGWLCWRVLVGLLCEFVRTTWWELIEWKESCALPVLGIWKSSSETGQDPLIAVVVALDATKATHAYFYRGCRFVPTTS